MAIDTVESPEPKLTVSIRKDGKGIPWIYKVSSLQDASALACAARDIAGLTSHTAFNIRVTGPETNAYVSYNGRVWDTETSGCLYDPRGEIPLGESR